MMKKIRSIVIVAIIFSAFAFTVFKTVEWKVKGEYIVKWEHGSFGGLKANISFDEDHPERSKITATIDARTVRTGSDASTTEAKLALGANKFPVITFISTAVKKTGSQYEATGNLTLKGITKEVKLPFTFNSKKDITDKFPFFFKETFYGKLTIAPKDFNVTGTQKQMTIELEIPVTQ